MLSLSWTLSGKLLAGLSLHLLLSQSCQPSLTRIFIVFREFLGLNFSMLCCNIDILIRGALAALSSQLDSPLL